MNLEEKTLQELKAIAYDLIASQEQTNRNLQAVNQMIAKRYEDAEKAKSPLVKSIEKAVEETTKD
jgi:hypothetical protein